MNPQCASTGEPLDVDAPDGPPSPARERDDLVIVGIGASAGGIEALEQFFRHTPEHSGLAFVVVQHLDPTQKGMMPELLQRMTSMTVHQARDKMVVDRDCVYVIPPNSDLSILGGALYILEPVAPRGLRLPVDHFFRALADDYGERSVGVILSGMGSDGTLGLRAIKEKAGLGLVQDPATASFASMPQSAIDAGLADIVAPADRLSERILAYVRQMSGDTGFAAQQSEMVRSDLEKVIILLRSRTGHDFRHYKQTSVRRRIERRMGIHQIAGMGAYVRYLQDNPQEVELLFKELLIGVTSFFRDPVAWECLSERVLPTLMAARPGAALRAWVPACSTGEEAYSLAMVFKEALDHLDQFEFSSLQIFATDLDGDAIERARRGFYARNIVADVTPERLRRFFTPDDGGYRVNRDIREMVVFATQDVLIDPPFTKVDAITCRNLLIYLQPEAQKQLLSLFCYSLNPEGVLFLGSAETIGAATDLFLPIESALRLYRRRDSEASRGIPYALGSAAPLMTDRGPTPKTVNLQALADRLLLDRFAPPAVLVDSEGDILYINGRTGRFLEPAAGKADWNVLAMAREGLRYEVASGLQQALREPGQIIFSGLRVEVNGGVQVVDLGMQAVGSPEQLRGTVLITFTEALEPDRGGSDGALSETAPDSHQKELEEQLARARADLATLREDMQTSQEELRAVNEELRSGNEELQSTNEELTTSREEMQSLNEELQTVNAELQAKVAELSQTNDDMRNLLNGTQIATVFLDERLRVRRFTPQATKVIKLIPSDLGRPLSDLVTDLAYPELLDDAAEVLRSLVYSQKEIPAQGGQWYAVRIMPYRTQENKIDGVVITFVDITQAKALEAELRAINADASKEPGDQG